MAVPLSRLITALDALAPLEFAEDWDNVGLLLDPRSKGSELDVERVLLTIDLAPAVVAEAQRERVDCVVAYHPPLFQAKKRWSRRADPALFAAAANDMAVYSPHTALDSAPDGLNDWLVSGFGAGSTRALAPAARIEGGAELKLVVFVPDSHLDALRAALSASGAGVIGAYHECSFRLEGEGTFFGDDSSNPVVGQRGQLERAPESRLEMVCSRAALPRAAEAIARVHPYEEPAWDVYALAAKPDARAGVGRLLSLEQPVALAALVERAKQHLGLPKLRLAASEEHARGALISRIAACAGAGGAALGSPLDAELVVTGEMRHHDVLAHLAAGRSVLLCEHSSSERGYLPRYRERILQALASGLEVLLATSDREPLEVV